jgi:hypothetical protein
MKTNNYEIFNFMPNNRPINGGLVKRLMASISDLGYINARPVIVNESMVIIDGQHRFEACKRLGFPIVYEISNIDMNKAMLALNANQVSWALNDFIVSHANQNISHYSEILEFNKRYSLGISNSILICCPSLKAKEIRLAKEFILNEERFEVVNFILTCKEYISFYNTHHFIFAVITLFKRADKLQIAKLLKSIQSLIQQPSKRHYLAAFENIINKSVKKESLKITLISN